MIGSHSALKIEKGQNKSDNAITSSTSPIEGNSKEPTSIIGTASTTTTSDNDFADLRRHHTTFYSKVKRDLIPLNDTKPALVTRPSVPTNLTNTLIQSRK